MDDSKPVWAPDGQSILFTRGSGQLVEISVATNAEREVGRGVGFPTDWSPDGKFLLIRRADQRTGYDIFGFELGAEKPFPVVQTDFDERDGEFSPDGRWIAFQSNESGRFEIYLQPFRNAESRKIQVSTAGGAQVRWRRDGKELFYIALDGRLMAAPIRFDADGRTAEPGAPAPLFAANVGGAVQNVAGQQYVVSADGRRFLLNTVVDQGVAAPLRLVLHWRGL
jgi:Tol biopolymer transport system component